MTNAYKLSPSKLRAVTSVVTHADCPDGIASAMILHDAIPAARIIFVRHNSPEMDALVASPGMLFCDITPPAHRVAEFVKAGAIVLDHHKTARTAVEAFGERGVFGDEVLDPGVSGAVLAYREVWVPLRSMLAPLDALRLVRDFATKAGVRDTWQRQDPLWGAACEQAEALLFYPEETWLETPPLEWSSLLAVGATLVTKRKVRVARLADDAMRISAGGKRIVLVSSTETSDVMDALVGEADIVAGFAYRCDAGAPRLTVSLRGRGVDVAAIAKRFGGGGHTAAAGFSVPVLDLDPHPYTFLRGLFERTLGEAVSS